MNEHIQDIFDKWKIASLPGSEQASFELDYTSIADEFMKLLDTWKVPYKVAHSRCRMCIITINYWDVMANKDYYSDTGVTEEIMDNYYA